MTRLVGMVVQFEAHGNDVLGRYVVHICGDPNHVLWAPCVNVRSTRLKAVYTVAPFVLLVSLRVSRDGDRWL